MKERVVTTMTWPQSCCLLPRKLDICSFIVIFVRFFVLSFDPITHQKSVPLHLFVVYVHVSCVVLISVACRHDCVADTRDPMSSQHGRNGVGNLGKRIFCALTYYFF